MSDETWKHLIDSWPMVVAQLVTLITAIATAIVAIITALRQGRTEAKLDENTEMTKRANMRTNEISQQVEGVRRAANGLTERLIKEAAAKARLEGAAEERARIEAEKKQ